MGRFEVGVVKVTRGAGFEGEPEFIGANEFVGVKVFLGANEFI